MRERHPGKDCGLPSFSPAWDHPTRLVPSGRQFNCILPTVGGCWSEYALTGESEPTPTRVRKTFIGFRLVRAA